LRKATSAKVAEAEPSVDMAAALATLAAMTAEQRTAWAASNNVDLSALAGRSGGRSKRK
jgi:hypothetical protein